MDFRAADHLDPLRHRAQVVAPIGSILRPESLMGQVRKRLQAFGGDRWPDPLDRRDSTIRVASGLVPDRGQLGDAVLQR